MMTPEMQDEAAQRAAMETMNVPDGEQAPVLMDEAGGMPEGDMPDIATLRQIRDEQGEHALTEDEWHALSQAEAQGLPQGKGDPTEHTANLAEFLPETTLASIGQKVVQWVSWDEQDRAEWYGMEEQGIRAMGVSPNVDGGAPFKGASTVVHPMLAEAIVQFQCRALEQLWPAGGPVKTAIMGKVDDERTAQSKRVEQFMNYQYTDDIQGAFDQTDQMLIRLPLTGSCFIKTWFDPVDGISRALVEPANFVVPYKATNLYTTHRYTEIVPLSPNELRKRQVSGLYRDIKMQEPSEEHSESDRQRVIDEVRATEGRQATTSRANDDQRHTLYECYCALDLPGFEHVGRDGQKTGIALEYIVTVDKDTQRVLSIYRNWRPTDTRMRRIVHHTHYKFMPGLGFYGFGLYHWIGGLARAATGALRALLDSAAFSNMQGGYRSKDASLKPGEDVIGPGEWKEIDSDADDLKKAFFPLPYKEPSAVLFNLLGYLEGIGRRFAGTTEAMVGEGSQDIAVGTILARIEQGSKVYTSIQKRLHEAAAQEYRLVAWLDSQHLPDEYPYAVEGEDRAVLRADFDDRIDVLPVSDPNVVSNVQRYFMSSLVMELSTQAPDLYDRREVHKRTLQSLKVENIDALLPPPEEVPPCDPVTENAKVMTGRAIKAFPQQAHQAHIAVHQAVLAGLPPDAPMIPVLQAHIQEHAALDYLIRMQQMTGVPFLEIQAQGGQVPPEVEAQVAMAAAEAAQQMQVPAAPDPEMAKAQGEIQRKDELAAAEIRRKDELAAAEIDRKAQTAEATVQLDAQKTAAAIEHQQVKQQIDAVSKAEQSAPGGW